MNLSVRLTIKVRQATGQLKSAVSIIQHRNAIFAYFQEMQHSFIRILLGLAYVTSDSNWVEEKLQNIPTYWHGKKT